MFRFLLIFSISLFCRVSIAQLSSPSEEPKWIQMTRNENANYYKVIVEFKAFWKYRQLPKEALGNREFEEFEEIEKEIKSFYNNLSEAEKQQYLLNDPYRHYDFTNDIRSFKGWMLDALAWRKDNGTIYTLAERQKIIDLQRMEMIKVEKANNK